MGELTPEVYLQKLQQIIEAAEKTRLIISADRRNVFVDYGPEAYKRWVVIGSNAAVPIDHDVAAALSPISSLITITNYRPPSPDAPIAPIHTFIKLKQNGVHIRPVAGRAVYLGETDPKPISQYNLQLVDQPALIRLGKGGYPIRFVARPTGVVRLVLNPGDIRVTP